LQVVAEFEVRIRGPGWRDQRYGRFYDALGEPWDALDEALVGLNETIPIRLRVQQLHHDAGGSGAVVAVGPPHQRFPRAHVGAPAPG
jgi:hypothetical protein